jgi:hypothetical protein
MLGRVVALLALPMAGLLAQGPVEVHISAANGTAFIIRTASDSARTAQKPITALGNVDYTMRGPITVAAADSVSQIHIEARENGRLIGTAEGPYVGVLRDSIGRVMVAARASIPKEPFSFSLRRP